MRTHPVVAAGARRTWRPGAAVLAALVLAGAARADSLRVLFIGNSHTFVNDLPGLFCGLSEAGARPARTGMSAIGGYSLAEHAANAETRARIAADSWDFVALQEQSIIPTIRFWRFNGMYPAARLLDTLIRAQGSRTVCFMTWGWKSGGQFSYRESLSPVFADYFEMQESVRVAYQQIGAELGARMSPVGMAWARARREDSLVDLWQADECHATLKGTYLAACVFYAVLHQASPVGLSFLGGLTAEEALWLQEIAWQTVSAVAEPRRIPKPGPATVSARPNPFRSATTISLTPCSGPERQFHIYDLDGRLVRALPGPAATWDGCDDSARRLGPGVYLCRVRGWPWAAAARLTLVR